MARTSAAGMTRVTYQHATRRPQPVTDAQLTAAVIALAIVGPLGEIAALILIGMLT